MRAGVAIAFVLAASACRPAPPVARARPVPSTADLFGPHAPRLAFITHTPELHYYQFVGLYQGPRRTDGDPVARERPPSRPRRVVQAPAFQSPLLRRAEQWRSLDEHAKALAAYEEILARPLAGGPLPDREPTYARYRKAHLLIAIGQTDEGIELLEYLAGTQSPERLAALDDLAELYAARRDPNAASRLFALAPDLVADLEPYLLAQTEGNGLRQAGSSLRGTEARLAEAEARLEEAIAREATLLERARERGFDPAAWQALADHITDDPRNRAVALLNVAESRWYQAERAADAGARSAATWARVAEAYQAVPKEGAGVVADVEQIRARVLGAWINAIRVVQDGGAPPHMFHERLRAGLERMQGERRRIATALARGIP